MPHRPARLIASLRLVGILTWGYLKNLATRWLMSVRTISISGKIFLTAMLILVLKATLKGPRLAPGTRLKIDLEDHGVVGVSGQRPHPIFRPERASPQGYQGLKSGRSAVRPRP
jgi:hypothetical protein